jgi:hypothetical protein
MFKYRNWITTIITILSTAEPGKHGCYLVRNFGFFSLKIYILMMTFRKKKITKNWNCVKDSAGIKESNYWWKESTSQIHLPVHYRSKPATISDQSLPSIKLLVCVCFFLFLLNLVCVKSIAFTWDDTNLF